ncbi:MAG: HzsA-related protein [Thermoguttaceae bacterium]
MQPSGARVHVRYAAILGLVSLLACFTAPVAGQESPENTAEPKLLEQFSKEPMAGMDEIVLAVRKPGLDGHWYANFSHYADDKDRITYQDGGRLCRLNLKTGRMVNLLEDPRGAVRDPQVHYDARRILFSYRPGGTEYYHLYEIYVDGTGLRQLTDGPYDDIEPTYLPDGDIVFVSSRCKRWVNCWLTRVAVLHRCEPDGGGIRAISANLEHDNTPWPLHDGRILYQRWEYVDRSQVDYHHLWTTCPDGTSQMICYGNMHPGTLMIDAKPIPGSKKIVAIFSPGHGRREHAGMVTVVDPSGGPDEKGLATPVSSTDDFRDPWAFSEGAFMAVRGGQVILIDDAGRVETVFALGSDDAKAGLECHEPRPLVARERETVIPERIRPEMATGRLVLMDVYQGRNMADVRRGEIKKLLVLESLPKPINFTGGMDPLTYGGSFTLERVLGTVPVEEDGSAHLDVPALRSLFFVALDQNDMAVKRMQSFLTVQPGEVSGCVGCHEQRSRTVLPPGDALALRRRASAIEPIDDCPDVFDFPRDIQPILDRLCVDCHGYEKSGRGGPYAGGLILAGDRGPMFSHSYVAMTVRELFVDGRDKPESNYAPRTIGSSASRILKMLDGSHYEVKATEHDKKMMRLWIEVGAPYPGTYAALGCGAIGGYAQNQLVNTDTDWPTTMAGAEVIQRRCAGCHQDEKRLPGSMSDELEISFWRFDIRDPRLRFSRHLMFNLSRPEKSLIALSPLAANAGGLGLCRDKSGNPAEVFADPSDPDCQTLIAMAAAGKATLDQIKRFDMPGFRPRPQYVREMIGYGILPPDATPESVTDPYKVDRQYWESLWYQPALPGL